MYPWLEKLVDKAKKKVSGHKPNLDDDVVPDPLIWSRDLEQHFYGDYSFAQVRGNEIMEDRSHVVTGHEATFVGVYDGHGGHHVSHFIRENLFDHLMRIVQENGTMSEACLKNAFTATEDGFLSIVQQNFGRDQRVAAIGSCCLVGVIWKDTLYVANLGDSRAVRGYLRTANKIAAEQLTNDHNASRKEVRQELRAQHPEDPEIVFKRQGVWHVKGLIQVSRAIGDAYLKRPEFALDPSHGRLHLPKPIQRPVLSADPATYARNLQQVDRFLIFASDGLWEHVTNQQAVELVHKIPRAGIAKRLLKLALHEAAWKRKTTYDELKTMPIRRDYHDDITVVVIFIDNEAMKRREREFLQLVSVKGGDDNAGPSNFNNSQQADHKSKTNPSTGETSSGTLTTDNSRFSEASFL